MNTKNLFPFVMLITGLVLASPASGESLAEAIATAWQNNPTIKAQRSSLHILEDRYNQAEAGYAPDVSLNMSTEQTTVRQDYRNGSNFPHVNTQSASVNFSQALYAGGRIMAGVSAAKADLLAGAEDLRTVEMKTMQAVIEAYIAVRRDTQIADISQIDATLLQKQLDDTQARAQIKEVTVTDVATAQSRLMAARAQAAQALGQLGVSRELYQSLVGSAPGTLESEPILPGIPINLDEALDAAATDSPGVLAALYNAKASAARVKIAKSANSTQVSLKAAASRYPSLTYDNDHYLQGYSVSVVVSKPLFNGGLNQARIEEALDTHQRYLFNEEISKRESVRAVGEAWARYMATDSMVSTLDMQVKAATTAFDGVQKEQKVGLRSTLDVLNLDQELSNAKISAAIAYHDRYSAQAALLLAMGRLDIYHLTGAVAEQTPTHVGRKVFQISPTEFAPRLLELLSKAILNSN